MTDETSNERLDVYDITFALPAQSFAITCWITTEETLPVVTEFALRLTHTCGTVSIPQLKSFFGFTDREATAVLRTLEEERLVAWEDERLVLTPYAHSRFLDSPDSIPRFFRISEWTGEVVFDLISFQHSRKHARHRRANSMVELVSKSPDKESKTIYWAERSFQESFRDIIRKDKVDIYKVSEVEGGERFMIQLPCTFSLVMDERLGIDRSLKEDVFSNQLEIAESISDALSRQTYGNNFAFAEFVDTFDSGFFSPYVSHGNFDLRKFIEEECLVDAVSEDGTETVLGCLYLPKNRAKLLDYARRVAAPVDIDGKRTFCTAHWIAPGSSLWGRSLSAGRLVEDFTRVLRGDTASHLDAATLELRSQAGLKTIFQCDDSKAAERLRRVHGHTFPMMYRTTGHFMSGQCELFIVPDKFVYAVFHYQIDSAISVPIGLLSMNPAHVEKAMGLLNGLVSSPREVFSLKWMDKEDKDQGTHAIDYFGDKELSVEESEAGEE